MKFIKIFLASSIREFSAQRMELEAYINQLNTIYVRKGLFFELVVCENLSNALVLERKQEEYNQEIRSSQFFYVLFGKEAGEYTLEEFEVALTSFRQTGAPRIYTYFQGLPEEMQEESVKCFMRRLDRELGHYYSFFEHIDSIKLNFLLELARHCGTEDGIKFEDGKAVLEGKEVLSLESIPVYAKNETLHGMREERCRLQKKLAELAASYSKNPSDPDVRRAMKEANERYQEISKEAADMENQLLKLCSMLAEHNFSDVPMTFREKEASRCLADGDYKGALAVLRMSGRQEEITQIKKRKHQMEQEAIALINETRLRVQTLFIEGLTGETVEECIKCYEEAMQLAEEFSVEMDILYEYAHFLLIHRKISRGLKVAKKLLAFYQKENTDWKKKKILYHLLGNFYMEENCFLQAEEMFHKVLKGLESEDKEPKSEKHRKDLMAVYNSIAGAMTYNGKYEEAEQYYREALKIQGVMPEDEQQMTKLGLADLHNNLAVLLKGMKRWKEAEAHYRQAIEIYGQIGEHFCDVPDVMAEELALSYYNLANVLADQREQEEAAQLYEMAAGMMEKMAEDNPDAYETMLLMIKAGQGCLYLEMDRPKEAEECLEIAMKGYERRICSDLNAYGPELIKVSYSYAALQRGWKKGYGKARKMYRNIIELYEKMNEGTEKAYQQEIAFTKNLLAEMFVEQGQCQRAIKEYEELVLMYLALSKQEGEEYEKKAASVYYNLAVLHEMTDKNKVIIRRLLQNSYELCEKYPDLAGKAEEIKDILGRNE